MEQSKLDNLLRVIEKNKQGVNDVEKFEVVLPDANETIEMRKLTFQEKKDFRFSVIMNKNGTVNMAETLSSLKITKLIYNCCGLSKLAVSAKEKGLIRQYYDIVEILFSADDLSTVLTAIVENNELAKDDELEQVKN